MKNINTVMFLTDLLPLAGCAVGFIYGACKFFKPKVALFLQIVVFSLGSLMLGKLYTIISYVSAGISNNDFNVGMLGTFGCFVFLLSANYGQMDGLVDGKEKKYRKYRVISLIAPAAIAAMYIPVALSGENLITKIIIAAMIVPAVLASYYNLKHTIIPDVYMGILASIRPYNVCALALCVFSVAELVSDTLTVNSVLTLIFAALVSIVSAVIVPVLEKGVKKWRM